MARSDHSWARSGHWTGAGIHAVAHLGRTAAAQRLGRIALVAGILAGPVFGRHLGKESKKSGPVYETMSK